MGVRGKEVCNTDEPEAPGDFSYFVDATGRVCGMSYCCPCGCGRQSGLRFRPTPHPPSWQWDGNRAQPTLHPSVHHIIYGVTHWHGWLKAGVWESC
jgi:hypothetical protein